MYAGHAAVMAMWDPVMARGIGSQAAVSGHRAVVARRAGQVLRTVPEDGSDHGEQDGKAHAHSERASSIRDGTTGKPRSPG